MLLLMSSIRSAPPSVFSTLFLVFLVSRLPVVSFVVSTGNLENYSKMLTFVLRFARYDDSLFFVFFLLLLLLPLLG